MSRRLRWFSAGAASAVATKLDIADHGTDAGPVCYVDTGSEHPDNVRFLADAAEWLGVEIVTLRSDKYADIWQVFKERRFLVGNKGALCTVELKKKVRFAFERPDDVQVFGYTFDPKDVDRADRFREQNPGVTLHTPLIDRELTKSDCLAMIERAGIELPAMYRLGYLNNNCIGCPKGGLGYWNMIRRDFPDVFDRMARQEREIGHACHHTKEEGMIFLDELDPERGDIHTDPDADCSLMCALAEAEIA